MEIESIQRAIVKVNKELQSEIIRQIQNHYISS